MEMNIRGGEKTKRIEWKREKDVSKKQDEI